MSEHLITKPLAFGHCPRCHAPLLAGHTAGIHTLVDPAPLDYFAEAGALLAGRNTYDLITEGTPPRLYLEWRCTIRIRASRRHPVVAAHPCPGRGFTPWPLPPPEPFVYDPAEPVPY